MKEYKMYVSWYTEFDFPAKAKATWHCPMYKNTAEQPLPCPRWFYGIS